MTDYAGALDLILARLKAKGYRSFDHYDFWGSRGGIWLRRNRNILTLPAIGGAYFLDILFPRLFRRAGDEKIPMETLPYVMRSMQVYKRLSGDDKYEDDREMLLGYMLSKLGSSGRGKGVGHQFDWYTGEMVPAYTPCVTLSAYLVDYLLELDPGRHTETLRQIGDFVFCDLNREENPDGTVKVSYTHLDRRWVMNANAYAARIMSRLGKHFGRPEYNALSAKLLRYVLSRQETDGSWYYFDRESVPAKDNFIDCFHTAFVLENLMEWAGENPAAGLALERGLSYFTKTFINRNGTVNHFAKSHLPIRICADVRSSAEAIACLALASGDRPELLALAEKVYTSTMRQMGDGAGGFYFRDYCFFRSRMDYARWGAAPMLNALGNLAFAGGK